MAVLQFCSVNKPPLTRLSVPQCRNQWGCSALFKCYSDKHMNMWKPIKQVLKITVKLFVLLSAVVHHSVVVVHHWQEHWWLSFVDESTAQYRTYFCAESRKIQIEWLIFSWDVLYEHKTFHTYRCLQCYINIFYNKIIPVILDTDKQVSHPMTVLFTKCRERLIRVILIKGIERNMILPSLSILSSFLIKTKIMMTS